MPTNKIQIVTRKFVLLASMMIISNYGMADSPLTTIDFWKTSQDPYVQKIGSKYGKKRLNKEMFSFLMRNDLPAFDKLALINALGWEFKSNISNSGLFAKYLINVHLDNVKIKNDFLRDVYLEEYNFNYDELRSALNRDETLQSLFITDFLLMELGESYFLMYQYLLAMDNYLDVSEIIENMNMLDLYDEEEQNIDFEANIFVRTLIGAQDSALIFAWCEVWSIYSSFLRKFCIVDPNVRSAVKWANNYMIGFKENCSDDYIFLEYLCNLDEFTFKNNQTVQIINYPVFVYGRMEFIDENNNTLLEREIDGDDLVELDLSLFPLGKFRAVFTERDSQIKHTVRLIIM